MLKFDDDFHGSVDSVCHAFNCLRVLVVIRFGNVFNVGRRRKKMDNFKEIESNVKIKFATTMSKSTENNGTKKNT